MSLRELIVERIRADGPLTFAEYMDLALYHPTFGYYARADRRSGRAGDFYTSVDVGPLFGQLLAVQFAEMWQLLGAPEALHVVEAGAGSGRLARDVLDAASVSDPTFYDAIRLHLIERSPQARAAQPGILGSHRNKIVTNTDTLPDGFSGIVFANELLDALPTHRVVMTRQGLRETHVDVEADRLVECTAEPSTPDLAAYFDRLDIALPMNSRADVNLRARDWVAQAAQCLRQGFLILIDYAQEARELYGACGDNGSLAAYRRHVMGGPTAGGPLESDVQSRWLAEPGEWDLTTHVDLTSVRHTAERHGMQTLGILDQTYFLLGLGAADIDQPAEGIPDLKQRLGVKTLIMPGGLGSTHKVLIFGKHVGMPELRGCSYGTRVT